MVDDLVVSDVIEVRVGSGGRAKRVYRTAQEKRRIVEATLVPSASIARVARENGVNANQVFQWRYEHRRGVCWAASEARAELLPVTVTAEPNNVMVPREGSPALIPSSSIQIELPDRTVISVESCVDPPWNPSRMSEAARLQLGFDLGTAASPPLTQIT